MTDNRRRFARAHLRSPLQRRVFTLIAAARAVAWTAGDMAGVTRDDPHDVDQMLRQFAAAGIVAADGSSNPPTYGWRPEMDYLLDGLAADTSCVDPICGMPVSADSAFREGTESFCSQRCRLCWLARRNRDGVQWSA